MYLPINQQYDDHVQQSQEINFFDQQEHEINCSTIEIVNCIGFTAIFGGPICCLAPGSALFLPAAGSKFAAIKLLAAEILTGVGFGAMGCGIGIGACIHFYKNCQNEPTPD